MVGAKFSASGRRLEITDTPSALARVFAWLFRVLFWGGLLAVGIGAVVLVVDLARTGDPWHGLEGILQGAVMAVVGWGSGRGWGRLVVARRTIVDLDRGTIELTEKAPGTRTQTRVESCGEVRAVRIAASEMAGPSNTLLRIHRIWIVLVGDRTVMVGDVGDVSYAVVALERVAGMMAAFFGVPLERAVVHDVPPTAEHVLVASAAATGFERTYPLMSWRQKLFFVPGLAIIVAGPMWLLLALGKPVDTLDCTRAAAGGSPTCTLGTRTLVTAETSRTFALDRAKIETRREEHRNQNGSTHTTTRLFVTPANEDAIEFWWTDEAPLVDFRDDASALAFHDDNDAKPIVLPIGFALMLIIPIIPMLATGGRLRVRIGPRELEVVRLRAFAASAPIRVPLDRGPVTLDVHRFTGRYGAYGRLTCTSAANSVVLVAQAHHDILRPIADDLAGALSPATSARAAAPSAAGT